MALRFFRSGNLMPPPSKETYNFDQGYDARAADRLKRNARRICKKNRSTVTLNIFVLASHAPLIDADPAMMAVGGSPVAATRLIRSAASGEAKLQLFCTVPPGATPAEVVEQLAAELERFHKRRLQQPCEYYCLHPALEGDGALDPLNRRPLHGALGPVIDGIGRFPFAPLALVPSVFAADRLVIEEKTEPQRRMVIYHSRLLLAQHLGHMSRLLLEVANHAHGLATLRTSEWRALKNAEVGARTMILFRAMAAHEAELRGDIVAAEASEFFIMDNFDSNVKSFFDDGVFFLRRSNAAFEATRIIMGRARTECLQRVACRERWESLVGFIDALWATMQRRARDIYTDSRLRLEIVSAASGQQLREDELFMSEKERAPPSPSSTSGERSSPTLQRTSSLLAGIKCSLTNSSLGATLHAVQEARTRRKHAMLVERASRVATGVTSDLIDGGLCGDPLASTIFLQQSKT